MGPGLWGMGEVPVPEPREERVWSIQMRTDIQLSEWKDRGAHHPTAVSTEEQPEWGGLKRMSCEEAPIAGVDSSFSEEMPTAGVDSTFSEAVPTAGVDSLSSETGNNRDAALRRVLFCFLR